MPDTRPVELVVNLPSELADDVESFGDHDPDYLGKALRYALARRIVFDELRQSLDSGSGTAPPSSLP